MTLGLQTVLAIAAVLVGYAWVANRMMHATQGLRLRFAEEALALIEDPRVSTATKQGLRRRVNQLFNRRALWGFVVSILPLFVLTRLGLVKMALPENSDDVDQKVLDTATLGVLAWLGLSPLAALLAGFQALILICLGVSIGGINSLFRFLGRSDHDHGPHAPHPA